MTERSRTVGTPNKRNFWARSRALYARHEYGSNHDCLWFVKRWNGRNGLFFVCKFHLVVFQLHKQKLRVFSLEESTSAAKGKMRLITTLLLFSFLDREHVSRRDLKSYKYYLTIYSSLFFPCVPFLKKMITLETIAGTSLGIPFVGWMLHKKRVHLISRSTMLGSQGMGWIRISEDIYW